MKVVLFCGGQGTRLREYSGTIPKPLVPIGDRPILWHLMHYYAYHGHTDFILCLGHQGAMIKEYFLNSPGSSQKESSVTPARQDGGSFKRQINGWSITFVDTGLTANIGERLAAVRPLIKDDRVFLANYTDGLTDLDLDAQLDHFKRSGAVASFARVRPSQTFHTVSCGPDGTVERIAHVRDSDIWINGGYFILDRSIFDYIYPGEELVREPFYRLVDERRLMGFTHDGFFASMDTYKDKCHFDELDANDHRPWEVWQPARRDGRATASC
jgi:glucose-1-phosphate cytidylyltransferase